MPQHTHVTTHARPDPGHPHAGGKAAARARRLSATVVRVAAVDARTRTRAWQLFAAAYTGADRGRFDRDFDAKHRVILLHDPADGSLQGFSTVHVGRAGGGRAATVVFSGDTVIAPEYWGSKALQQAFAALLLRERLRHPRRPLYWFLISKGYKTYLMLARAFPRSVPRAGREDDPVLRRVLDEVATQRFGPAYDASTGIIRHATPLESVRAGLCPVDAALLADPDVAFFVARNPGHTQGDELACLAHVRLRDVTRQIARNAARRARTLVGVRR